MNFEKEHQQDNIDESEKKMNDQIQKYIEWGFSGDRKLYRDVLNFWMQINFNLIKSFESEKLKDYINNIKPIPYYEQGYREKGEREVETMKNENNKNAEYHEKYYTTELRRITEISDKEQVEKYNNLVDKFNADLDRIKKESDINILEDYFNQVIEILDEKYD